MGGGGGVGGWMEGGVLNSESDESDNNSLESSDK